MDKKMNKKINIDKIKTEVDGDLIFVTVAKYKLFLSYGKIGMDAYLLYSHLIFTARLQQTNQVKATNLYLRQGLCWTKERLSKAKNLLYDLSLIETIKTRDEFNKFTGAYIKVKTKTTPFEIEQIKKNKQEIVQEPEKPDCGNPGVRFSTTNALTKNKMLKQKNKYIAFFKSIIEVWNNSYIIVHSDKYLENNIKKKHYDILKNNSEKNIIAAIKLYKEILVDNKYYWTKKWTLLEFLSRGLEKFMPETNPKDRYKKSDYKKELSYEEQLEKEYGNN
jgi:hypothetical protein